MTAAWMLYVVAVGLLITTAALLLERPLRERWGATRKLWIGLIFVAVLWPVAMIVITTPPAAPTLEQGVEVALRGRANDQIPGPADFAPTAPTPVVSLPAVLPPSATLDSLARRIALAGPVLLVLMLVLEVVRLGRARRRWRREVVDGVPVLVSRDFGPAIVGIWHPAIVIPEWALTLASPQRALMLAHEVEHLAARDSSWLGLGFLGVALAPWNPALWFLLRRFRLAMEVDCDQRVLRRGFDVERYANLLIEMGQRSSSRSLLAAGFAERRSMLRTRIEAIVAEGAPSFGGRYAPALAGVLVLLAACAIGPAAPESSFPVPVPITVALAPRVADSVVTTDNRFAAIRAGRNLPTAFQPDPNQPGDRPAAVPTCPNLLIDSRDGTRLRLEVAMTAPTTANPAATTTGYYSVTPAGRYGVTDDEFLRVGCVTPKLVPAGPDHPAAMLSLNSTLKSEFGITIDSLTRTGGQLHLAYVATPADTTKSRATEITRFLWQRLGDQAVGIDTVTVAIRYPNGWVRDVEPPMTVHALRWWLYRERDHLDGK